MRLLVVEDDEMLGKSLVQGLELEGYAVDWVKDGVKAESYLDSQVYEVIILDLGLPGQSGLDLLRKRRHKHDAASVLILTARDTSHDKVVGLDTGADDYMVKPFDLDELCARIRALSRRQAGRSEPKIVHGDVELDPASHQVTLAGEPVTLSQREYAVLHMLMSNQGRVMSRRHLEEALYSWDQDVESNAVEVHIHHIRKKLGSKFIRTMRGVGYIIDKPA